MERSRWIYGPKYISFSNRYNDGPEIMRREVKLNYTNYGICVQVVGNMHLFVIMWPSVELCRFMQLFLTYSWMILNIFQLQTAVVIFKILLLLHFCTLFYVKVYSVYFHFPQFCSSWIFFFAITASGNYTWTNKIHVFEFSIFAFGNSTSKSKY